MLGLLACSEAYEFGQLGTGLSWFNTVPKADEFFMGFVGGGGNIAIATALPSSSFVYFIVNIK